MSRTQMQGYTMSDSHKERLAVGREQSRVIRDYLTSLAAHQPRRGRRRTTDSIEKRILLIEETLAFENDPLSRLRLISEREALQEELSVLSDPTDLDEVEQRFVQVAAEYSQRKGISYAAWRAVGVPASVLRSAGIARAA